MGVYEDRGTMHWQQNERYISSYEAGGDLSPAAPANSPGSPRDCTSCRKREPPDEPPAPPEDCAGCGSRITDRYYLLALERRWHTPCLRCCECKMPLDSEQRCYARDSNIFCKNDYFRLYGSKRCARCNTTISASELVMRARDLVFHVHCFSCALCSTHLNKGDTFGIRDSAVYCRLHYETMPEYGPHMSVPGPPQLCPGPYVPPGPHYPPYPSPEFARGDADVAKGFFNGTAAPPPRQKGRPRKKKPKDQDIMSANLDLNPEYLEMGFRGGGSLGSSSRTKRMRTSFKHHQLRTMKSYFAINHNPDAKDLKQLSQKTGLPKRVLQVLVPRRGSNGVVPKRASEVAANGDEARKQDGGQVLPRRFARDGHVPRAHGFDPVAASPQPPLQRDGRPPEPKLHGLPIARVLRLMSASVRNYKVWIKVGIRKARTLSDNCELTPFR